MNLERLMVIRAEQQMKSALWRISDYGEERVKVPPEPGGCMRCHAPVHHRKAGMCHACGKAGWRPAPCPQCGGFTHKRDRSGKRTNLYGWCGECRRIERETRELS